jgi:hypothetical protein
LVKSITKVTIKLTKMAFTGGEGCNCGMGTWFGTSQTIHWTFWANLVIQVIFAIIQYSNSWKYILLIATVWGPSLLLALVFHEMGHVWRTKSFGGTCSSIMYWPLGGFSDCNIKDGTCKQEFFVALCGPLMHIPQFFVWLAIMAIAAPNGIDYYGTEFSIDEFDNGGADQWFASLAKRTLDLNIIVFALNLLLPAYPLDAARMVASMCVHWGLLVETAGFVLVVIGGLLGFACLLYGIVSMVSGSGPGLFLLFIAIFVLWTSWSLYNMVKQKTIDQHPIFQPDCYRNQSGPPPARKPVTSAQRDVELGNNAPQKSQASNKQQPPTRNKPPPGQKPKRQPNSAKKGPKKHPPQK